MVDETGELTLAQAYLPYGETLSRVGNGATSYGFTGEATDATGLVYLRARYYAPGAGRFLMKDPSGREANLYLYGRANPINRTDPSGLFSIQQIASSYQLSEEQMKQAFSQGTYNSTLKGKWGWLKLLLDAHEGESLSVGVPGTFPPYLDMFGPRLLTINGCKILVGGQSLEAFTAGTLNMPLAPVFWWRSTKPNHYFLEGQEYMDADRIIDLPDYRIMGLNALTAGAAALALFPATIAIAPIVAAASQFLNIGVGLILDRYGNLYAFISFGVAPNFGGGAISGGEGYIAGYGQIVNQVRGVGSIPSEQTVKGTITGPCGNLDINILLSSGGVSICTSLGTSVVYGYALGVGGLSLGVSYGIDLFTKISPLAWDYIERKPGITQADIY